MRPRLSQCRWVLLVAALSCIALSGPGLLGVAGAGEKVVVWWNKGFYKEEDEGLQKIAEAFGRENNVEVDLTFTIQDDLAPKVISALIARRTPDVVFCVYNDWQIAPKYAWEDKLLDVTDVVSEMKPRYFAADLQTGWMYNNVEKKWSYYGVPMMGQMLGTFYWKDLVQEAGFDPDQKKIPMTWNEYWAFWKKVQDALRQKDPGKYGKLYGIGLTSSSRATDTFYKFEQYLLAFRGEIVTPDGKLVAGEAKNREAIVKTLSLFTGLYAEGYVPPDALNWTDADNNTNFNNRTVVMTPNPTISIPASHYFTNKDNYYNKIGSILQPTSPVDGKEYPYLDSVKLIIIPKDAKQPALAKKFVRYALDAKNFAGYVIAAGGRWFPSFKDVAADPFFHNPADPHIPVVTEALTKHETRPFYYSFHPAYSQVYIENVWGRAISRVVTEKWSNERAADEAVARIKTIFEGWK